MSLRSKPPASFDLENSSCACGQPLGAQPGLATWESREMSLRSKPPVSCDLENSSCTCGQPLGAQAGLAAWESRQASLRSKPASLLGLLRIVWMAFFALPACAQSPAPVGELFASEPGVPAMAQPAGTGITVLPGSELAAGIAPATLKLARGGQIRICPRSGLNLNAAGQGLMVGMNTGAIEIDYRLGPAATDQVLTPDFNIRLAGPAVYHFALGVNSKGDTCIKPLSGNGAGIVFSELLGADVYGVAVNESAVFAGGKLASKAALTSECGCAAPPVQTAQSDAPPSEDSPRKPGVPGDVTAPLPPDRPGATHLEVNTPFVFSAKAAVDARPNAVARIQFSSLPNVYFVQEEAPTVVLVEKTAEVSTNEEKPKALPAPQAKKEKKGFLARVKGFFGSILHR
jgi:hypothetical protein